MTTKDQKTAQQLRAELGLDEINVDPDQDERSLFGSLRKKDIPADELKTNTMTDEEWFEKKMPLPTFFNSNQ